MEPTGNGVGGDLFAIVWDAKTRKLYGLNGSGRSPKSLTLAKLREELRKLGTDHIPPRGPLPVSVPGAVDGWFELHGKFGKLPMKDLLQPAIDYARNGFPVTEVIAEGWARNAKLLKDYPNFAATYMPNGRAPAKGEVFRNPLLANTLTAIANGGRDAFYKGDIAQRIEKYFARERRLSHRRRPGRAPFRVGRTRVHQLPRLRRLGAAAEHAGHRRAADAEHPRGLRPEEDGFRQHRLSACVRRGQEARVRRSRALLRRPRNREDSAEGAAVEGLRGQTPHAHPARPGREGLPHRPQVAGAGRHYLPDGGGWCTATWSR